MDSLIQSDTVEDDDGKIARLESELAALKSRRNCARTTSTAVLLHPSPESIDSLAFNNPSPNHALLLLSDSALPLGSFAFSSGLESFIAHHKPLPAGETPLSLFQWFLRSSVTSLAGTTVPYLLYAYRYPELLQKWDNDLDASTLCVVSRRASIAQGRALLGVWERAFSPLDAYRHSESARASLDAIRLSLRTATATESLGANGHFAPIWSLVCLSMGLTLRQTVYLFLFNHAKSLLSAAVRASLMGPYQAQAILASPQLQGLISDNIAAQWERSPEEAGQTVPLIDLWIGRHELLYSRIFNS